MPETNSEASEQEKPNKAELLFLNLAYNRFYDIYAEIMDDAFWERDPWYRFSKVKDGFCIYSELLNYEPLRWVLESLKTRRPPMEAEIAKELFKFVRNVITHFPFFDCWDDVYFNRSIVNWYKENQFIDKFMSKYSKHEAVKYRFWEADKKRMTYLSINFPSGYEEDNKVYLKDFLAEKEGVKFAFILMKQVLNSQVERIKES
jgi:hypothetical protein